MEADNRDCNVQEKKKIKLQLWIRETRGEKRKKQKWTVKLMSTRHAHEPIYRRVIEHTFQFKHTYDSPSARRLRTQKECIFIFLYDCGYRGKENKAEMAVANGASVAVCYWSAAVKWLRLWNWGIRDVRTHQNINNHYIFIAVSLSFIFFFFFF